MNLKKIFFEIFHFQQLAGLYHHGRIFPHDGNCRAKCFFIVLIDYLFDQKTAMKYGRESFKTLAEKYQLSLPTFKKNIKIIRERMDACVGRSNYRYLVPRQVEIIVEHLGEWGE